MIQITLSFNIEESNLLNEIDETENSNDNISLCNIPFNANISIVDHLPSEFFALHELSKSTELFIQSCLQYNLEIAIKILICKASYCTDKIDIKHTLANSSEDYENFLTRAMMVIGLGSTKRLHLSKMIYLDNRKNRHIQNLPLPSDELSFQQMVLRNDAGFSLTRLLPVPKITIGTNRHAFIGLFALIQHSMLFLQCDDKNEKYTNLIKSLSAQTILDHAKQQINEALQPSTLIALVISWFDDWDKNSSISKSNKTSIFSGVHTIVFVNQENNLIGFYTNLSCVGLKEANHQDAIRIMNNDVINMQTNYASKKLLCLHNKTFYHVYPSFLYLIADQPAKRGLCGMLGGNSVLHPCFGYSLNVLLLKKQFNACNTCQNKLYKNQIPKQCNQCHCWNLPQNTKTVNAYKYKTPINLKINTNIVRLSNLNTHAGTLSFDFIKQVWEECYFELINASSISFRDRKSNVKKKLSLVCINDATIENFLQQIEDKQSLPSYPALWYFLSIDQLVEATMHLSAGVIKATTILIHDWAHKMGNNKLLYRHMNGCIKMFSTYCRIDSYRLVTYTDNYKFPGWIADTCRT